MATKAKLSTVASKPADTVLLRDTVSKRSHPFAKDHAARLLAYPGTLWQEITEGNAEAGAAKTAPAVPSEPDATGHPTEV